MVSFAPVRRYLAFLFFAALLAAACHAGDVVPIKMLDGTTMRCEVVKMTKSSVDVKADGKLQTLPFKLITPREVKDCYAALANKDAALRFDMASYFFDKQMFNEAEEELKEAIKLDPKLAEKAAALLKNIEEKKNPAAADPKPVTPDKPATPDKVKDPKDTPATKTPEKTSPEGEEGLLRFARMKKDPLTDAQMKEFLEKRKEELKSKIGGEWRLIETAHFYCFSNLPEPKHRKYAFDWLEKPTGTVEDPQGIYPLLCMILKHKEGDKLWNNKCPIYYFETYEQFQRFAAEIDHSPGAGMSGGYFSAQGREVHICIPFMTKRFGEKGAEKQARSTLYHEGTHAFLQLTGEDVPLNRWLHEGMAQFIEFWVDRKNNSGRSQRVDDLMRACRAGDIPSWSSMRERPMGGMDGNGYSWAWAKLEYLYRNFPKGNLPDMIRAIKAGTDPDEAMAKTFSAPVDKLEAHFQVWIKEYAKKGMNFGEQ